MRILLVGEFSGVSTGYGKITKELAQRLHNDGYEIAELACFCHKDDPKLKNIPWKVYPNLPSNKSEEKIYNSNRQNSNGKWKFEEVLLDFKPTHVFGNGDPFFYEYQQHSPFREYFNWIVAAPVDGIPQHNQWIQIFDNTDGLMAYTDWGKKVLEDYGLKVNGVFSPVASNEFFKIPECEVEKFKQTFGIGDKKIIGTIMRNQPRKLFDSLFSSFSKYSKINNNALLYCHTTYPDDGWDIPELLIKHNIIHKVLFTYKCSECQNSFPGYFQDLRSTCPFCKNLSAKMPDGANSIDNQTLNKVINLFNVYVQLASREGLGIPQVEACSCDVPVITMKYAGMTDIVNKIGHEVKTKTFYLSYPMNMMEAVPDEEDLIEKIDSLINLKKDGSNLEKYKKHYESWDKSYKTFVEIINSLPVKSWNKKEIVNPVEYTELNISNEEYVKFLIDSVLCEPDLKGSYFMTRMINDLNSGISFGGLCGSYFTENGSQSNYSQFNRKIAYGICLERKMFKDHWQEKLNNE